MNLQVLELKDIDDIANELRSLRVHPGGVGVMAPKGILRFIKVSGIDSAALNILKQEMLSVGGDCAVPWDAFTERRRDCEGIIIGSRAQMSRLCDKLARQPFGLSPLGERIRLLEAGYDRADFVLRAGRYELKLGERTYIMGALNVTPDSFSDGGLYADKDSAVERAVEMEAEGADIIDVGGESSRPGAKRVSAEEECERVLPVIKVLAKKIKAPISIDTSKAEVAQRALGCGAAIVNDITGLREGARMARLLKEHNAAVVLMHMKGTPRTMQSAPRYKALIPEILDSLRRSVEVAKKAGVQDDRIVIDPGIGFGKTAQHNLRILRRLREFKSLGYPILVGTSRKSFIGRVLGAEVGDRLFGTAASVAAAIHNGASIIRVHDVYQMKQVARLTDAILKS